MVDMDKFLSPNYVKTIAETSNISAAAEKLGISQPALSAYLKKQEEQLGALLFDRSKQPLELTEAGRVYLQYADRFSALEKEFRQHIADLEELKQGRLTIGGASFFNVSYLPRAVACFTSRYPGIEVEILDGTVPEISIQALNGQLDLFISPPWGEDDERFYYERLLEERIFLCVPPDWEINRKLQGQDVPVERILEQRSLDEEPLSVADFRAFQGLPFVLLQEDQHIGHVMSALFQKYGVKPGNRICVQQTMTSYALTLAGVGISLITESSVRNSGLRSHPKLYFVDREICRRGIFVVYPKQKYLSRAAKAFIQMLKTNI